MPYELKQFMQARALLREKLNLPAEQFDDQKIVGMLSDEIERALKENLSAEEIVGLMKQAGIHMSVDQMQDAYGKMQETKAKNNGQSWHG